MGSVNGSEGRLVVIRLNDMSGKEIEIKKGEIIFIV